MSEITAFRLTVITVLAGIFLAIAVGLGVRIYHLAHPTNIKVWCDWNSDKQIYDTHYQGPADQLIGACQVRR